MATATRANTKGKPAIIVSSSVMALITAYGKADKAKGEAFRNICRFVKETPTKVGDLYEGFMKVYNNDQIARNETSKVMKICVVDEVYERFMKREITAEAAKSEVTKWDVKWQAVNPRENRTWEDNNGVTYKGDEGSQDADKKFRHKLVVAAKYGITTLELRDLEIFLGEAEEAFKESLVRFHKKNKKGTADADNGEEEPTDEAEYSEEGALEEEEDEEQELKVAPARKAVKR